MAKIRYGMIAGSVSGSQGNTVFSHNRYGAYIRERTVPTKATSVYANAQKAIFTNASKFWGNLPQATRLQWKTWCQTNPIVDRLGDKRILTGAAALTKLNAVILTAGGTPITEPPTTPAPAGLESASATYDIGAGNFQVTFAPTPLEADEELWIWAAVTNSPGVSYVENLYKLCFQGAAATTSPASPQSGIEARFGTLVVGQQVFLKLQVINRATGLTSGFTPLNGVVVST